jgi:hypothetical protein
MEWPMPRARTWLDLKLPPLRLFDDPNRRARSLIVTFSRRHVRRPIPSAATRTADHTGEILSIPSIDLFVREP